MFFCLLSFVLALLVAFLHRSAISFATPHAAMCGNGAAFWWAMDRCSGLLTPDSAIYFALSAKGQVMSIFRCSQHVPLSNDMLAGLSALEPLCHFASIGISAAIYGCSLAYLLCDAL